MQVLMEQYIDALQMRLTLYQQSDIEMRKIPFPPTEEDFHRHFYLRPDNAMELGNAYINHVTHETQARLSLMADADQNAAWDLHKFIVETTGRWARQTEHFNMMSYVSPKPEKGAPAYKSIAIQHEYGQEVTRYLSDDYRDQKIVNPKHAARLLEREAQARKNQENIR